ncbi:TPA_asm: P3 [Plectranthus aromaticus virus 1]|uniref:P3 n=1 Tax=Plectranthus aromaticus virus 1 TaxID=2793738 RepID=A0A8D9PGZ5_9RHAB|nr:P3 [Plectranthus aromaticus virus 1]DAF42299.1 TPA_asm: P3 [Plectranthus aromaticus virus 1]
MAKNTGKQPNGALPEGPSKFTAYNSVLITGAPANVHIEKKNFVMSVRMLMTLQSYLWGRSHELTISKIITKWCPRVEPGNLSTINMRISYYLGDEEDDVNADDTILCLKGRISEQLVVVVYPTVTIIKAADRALFIPWTVSVDADNVTCPDSSIILGELKMWCKVEMTGLSFRSDSERVLYKPNVVSWSNLHYPYYIPFYMEKKVRGIGTILWRDTEQYKKFQEDVGKHMDGQVITEKDTLPLMQMMSLSDYKEVSKKTEPCHSNRGGLCTCGEGLTRLLASILVNNDGRCLNHGEEFDIAAKSVLTGKIKTVSHLASIKF